jgi:hypothetical protein
MITVPALDAAAIEEDPSVKVNVTLLCSVELWRLMPAPRPRPPVY